MISWSFFFFNIFIPSTSLSLSLSYFEYKWTPWSKLTQANHDLNAEESPSSSLLGFLPSAKQDTHSLFIFLFLSSTILPYPHALVYLLMTVWKIANHFQKYPNFSYLMDASAAYTYWQSSSFLYLEETTQMTLCNLLSFPWPPNLCTHPFFIQQLNKPNKTGVRSFLYADDDDDDDEDDA